MDCDGYFFRLYGYNVLADSEPSSLRYADRRIGCKRGHINAYYRPLS